ncbi:alpha-2-macroglobulin [Candidatus Roizmanbacteria bacterium]|nr:alpha-2-macroglobulin [Candidatus Roizmanbacteria bacterium]
MTTGPYIQGKLDIGVNSYCINTTGNWAGCGACHVGLGVRPEPVVSQAQLENIDCLICHQDDYKRKKVNGTFVPDTGLMTISIVQAAQTVHRPTRKSCLQCHAKGGGGDNYKRGDMAIAHGVTADRNFDVHMATTGANLACQACHTTEEHHIAGRGSDLRQTDLDVDMTCTRCHTNKASTTGHANLTINRHVARVACQTCHIATYARNATDTTATEMTETHRDWRQPHVTASGAIHPTPTMAGNLTPRYAWWNGTSSNHLLFDDAVYDPQTGRIPTSRPIGDINEFPSKLYPFKYKTATQPLATELNQLIALDTSVYFLNGNVQSSIESGLANMGYLPNEPYSWVETDTMQLLTHEIAPASAALACTSCHNNTSRMDLTGALGYQLKGLRSSVCIQCHEMKSYEENTEYLKVHDKHVSSKKYDCSWCHDFSRPERGLTLTPILTKLTDVINILKIMVGQTPATSTSVILDKNGDGKIGLAEAIGSLRDAANL